MKRWRRIFKPIERCLLCVSLAFAAFAFVACDGGKETPKKQAEFKGIKDVRISVSTSEYDFANGVIAVDEAGKTLEVTVDASAVRFGEAGQYTVKYKTANGSSECNVYVYGTPSVQTTALDIPYTVATGALEEIASLITATDTFGGKASVVVNDEIALNANGSVKTGAQEVSVTATDGYGNVAQETVTLNVQPSEQTYDIADQTVDYARAYATVELTTESTLLSVYVGEQICTVGDYAFDNGYFMLLPKLVASLGVGEYVLTLNFNDGTKDIALEITDSAEPALVAEFDLTGEVFVERETVTLPSLSMAEYSIQQFDVKTYIKAPSAEEKQEIASLEYLISEPGEYVYTADCIKNAQVVKTITQTFSAVSLVEYYGQNFIQEEHLPVVADHGCEAKTFEKDATVNGNELDAFKIVLSATATSNNGLCGFAINEKYMENARLAGYTVLEITAFTRSGFAVYDGAMDVNSLRLFYDKTTEAREITLRIDLNKITKGTAHVYMFHNASEAVDVFITKLQFIGLVQVHGSLVNANTVELIAPTDCTVSYEANKIRIHSDNTAQGSANAPYVLISAELIKQAIAAGYTHLRIKAETICGLKGNAGNNNGTNLWYADATATESRELSTDNISLEKLGDSALWIAFYHNVNYGEGIPSDLYITEMEFIKK